MNYFKYILLVVVTAIAVSSCYKGENKLRHNLSGLYDVKDVRMEFYSSDAQPDSTREWSDLGTVALTDAAEDDIDNPFIVYFDYVAGMPLIFERSSYGEQLIYKWGLDGDSDKRLNMRGMYVRIYTILKSNPRKLEVEYIEIEQTTNTITYRELITFKRR